MVIDRRFLTGAALFEMRLGVLANPTGTDVGVSHVWSLVVSGGSPRFLCTPTLGVFRPGVGARFGSQYENAGYRLQVTNLPTGIYDIAVFGHSATSHTFPVMRTVRITVP